MDRKIVYEGSIPFAVDLLTTNQNVMVALGDLIASVLGTGTQVNGLACTPTTPASMSVQVAAGSIYSLQSLEASAYGTLTADTTHQIVKQGLVLDSQTFACAAPSTTGQSRVYLIQVAYQDSDTGSTVLPYYSASTPSVPYSGPANSGVSQNTTRKGVCTVQVKAGTAATTGTQVTPTPDPGYTGLYAITVANGQTTITSGNIAPLNTAPFIGSKLTQRLDPAKNLADVLGASTALANLGGAPLSSPVFTGFPYVNGASGTTRFWGSSTAGSPRWRSGADSDAETGSNAGSRYAIVAYDDGGTLIDQPLTITRAAGGAMHTTRPFTGVTPATNDISTKFATTAYVLPASLPSQNGYRKHPDGTIEQWGVTNSIPLLTTSTNNFSIAFPNACWNVQLTSYTADTGAATTNSTAGNYTTTTFDATNRQNNTASFAWRAIGN